MGAAYKMKSHSRADKQHFHEIEKLTRMLGSACFDSFKFGWVGTKKQGVQFYKECETKMRRHKTRKWKVLGKEWQLMKKLMINRRWLMRINKARVYLSKI
jgi:hypothetical protein